MCKQNNRTDLFCSISGDGKEEASAEYFAHAAAGSRQPGLLCAPAPDEQILIRTKGWLQTCSRQGDKQGSAWLHWGTWGVLARPNKQVNNSPTKHEHSPVLWGR